MTTEKRVDGQAKVGDLIAYEDQANPKEVYRVVETGLPHGQYRLHSVETEEPTWSDLRQFGWTFVPADVTSQACESGWTGDRCTLALFHEGPHSNEAQPLVDIGFVVSLGEVPESLVVTAATALRQALQAAAESWLKDADNLWDLDETVVERLGALNVNVDRMPR